MQSGISGANVGPFASADGARTMATAAEAATDGREAEAAEAAMMTAGATSCVPAAAGPAQVRDEVARVTNGERPAVTGVPPQLLSDAHRLRMLHDTGLEPGGRDRWFDTITDVAADLLPATTTLVSLVGADSQFFPGRSHQGRHDADRQTPLSQSFCQWPVASGERLVVEDSHHHPVLRHNAAVHTLDVRAYAGVPLEAGGATLGTVCAVEYEPRQWDDEDLDILTRLAEIAECELALRLATTTGDPAGGTGNSIVLPSVKRGIGQATRLLDDARPDPTSHASRGLIDLIGWFTHRLPDTATDLRAGEPMAALRGR